MSDCGDLPRRWFQAVLGDGLQVSGHDWCRVVHALGLPQVGSGAGLDLAAVDGFQDAERGGGVVDDASVEVSGDVPGRHQGFGNGGSADGGGGELETP